jgi:uncharacterized protein YjbI with pentapeptide repeats
MCRIKLLNKTSCRVGLALLIAYFIFLGVSVTEKCIKNPLLVVSVKEKCIKSPSTCLTSIFQRLPWQALSLISLENIEGFSILAAASLYMLESGERKQKAIYEAWQVIDNLAEPNVETSYARIQALEDLCKYDKLLTDLNLTRANLQGINLTKAKLMNTKFYCADLSDANLSGADLSGADLSCPKSCGGNYRYTNLSGAELKDTIFKGADISGANFTGAKSLTPEQIKSANNWEKAIYDDVLSKQLGLT